MPDEKPATIETREWTREELDRVHPLPEGWAWARRLNGSWFARHFANGARCEVWVSAGSLIAAVYGAAEPESIDPPVDVALPVILASKGLDSLGEMADEMALEAAKAKERARTHRLNRQTAMAYSNDGQQSGLTAAAAMLRRGRVQP